MERGNIKKKKLFDPSTYLLAHCKRTFSQHIFLMLVHFLFLNRRFSHECHSRSLFFLLWILYFFATLQHFQLVIIHLTPYLSSSYRWELFARIRSLFSLFSCLGVTLLLLTLVAVSGRMQKAYYAESCFTLLPLYVSII